MHLQRTAVAVYIALLAVITFLSCSHANLADSAQANLTATSPTLAPAPVGRCRTKVYGNDVALQNILDGTNGDYELTDTSGSSSEERALGLEKLEPALQKLKEKGLTKLTPAIEKIALLKKQGLTKLSPALKKAAKMKQQALEKMSPVLTKLQQQGMEKLTPALAKLKDTWATKISPFIEKLNDRGTEYGED
ncbi:unnamed protein product [Phytophthora lilii]|uniref:Unnamed protein product n=1 Tax=Phytophthora lilii TaxID=2077276 RepID=A0A9W6U3G3_9STRA|nr:unnamed protein product [Phytophthora lilii]